MSLFYDYSGMTEFYEKYEQSFRNKKVKYNILKYEQPLTIEDNIKKIQYNNLELIITNITNQN